MLICSFAVFSHNHDVHLGVVHSGKTIEWPQ